MRTLILMTVLVIIFLYFLALLGCNTPFVDPLIDEITKPEPTNIEKSIGNIEYSNPYDNTPIIINITIINDAVDNTDKSNNSDHSVDNSDNSNNSDNSDNSTDNSDSSDNSDHSDNSDSSDNSYREDAEETTDVW